MSILSDTLDAMDNVMTPKSGDRVIETELEDPVLNKVGDVAHTLGMASEIYFDPKTLESISQAGMSAQLAQNGMSIEASLAQRMPHTVAAMEQPIAQNVMKPNGYS